MSWARSRKGRLIATLGLIVVVAALGFNRWSERVCCALPPIFVPTPEPATPRPADLLLEVSGQTGSVAPRYFYRYRLNVGPGTHARYTYMPGYDSAGPTWKSEFEVSEVQLDSLWGDFQTYGLRRMPKEGPVPAGQQSVGGGSQYLTIVTGRDTIELDGGRRDGWGAFVRITLAHADHMVSDSLRAQMDEKHRVWSEQKFGRER